MKMQTMTAVVALTILITSPALANQSLKAVSGTGNAPAHKVHVMRDIKAFFLGEKTLEPVLIKRNSTAEGLIDRKSVV